MIGSKNTLVFRTLLLLLLSFFATSCSLLPAPTKGVITGRVLLPPEIKISSKDVSGWMPVAGAEVTIVDAKGIARIKKTDKNGYYNFENTAVKANTVVTAITNVNEKTILLKKTIPINVEKYKNYDVGILTPESTALALIVERILVLDKEAEISLSTIKNTLFFDELVELIKGVLKASGNVTENHEIDGLIKNIVDELNNEKAEEEGLIPPEPSAKPAVKAINITTEPADVNGLDNDEEVIVELTITTPGATIYYSIDGTVPTSDSTKYNTPIIVKTDKPEGEIITLKAVGIKSGYENSAISAKEIVFKVKTYTLSYNAGKNGNIIGDNEQTVEHGRSGMKVEAVPDEGYHFVEWSDGCSDNPRTDTDVTDDIDITAGFTINIYTITFDCDGGSDVESQKVSHGETVIKPVDPTKADCIFKGWYKNNSLTDVWNVETDLVTESITLYARWIELLEIRWDFEDEFKREAVNNSENINEYTPDKGDGELSLIGAHFGSSIQSARCFTDGSDGEGSYAAHSDTWNSGANKKYWQIKVSTEGYENIKLSSKQRGDGTGPRDFKVQFSTDGDEWIDIDEGSIKIADDFTSGTLDEISLPQECEDKQDLYLRWVMTTNKSIRENDNVGPYGTNRIDNIVITGKSISIP